MTQYHHTFDIILIARKIISPLAIALGFNGGKIFFEINNEVILEGVLMLIKVFKGILESC